jgi:ABC-type antimicrobial peptide transport system permease subunit
LSLLRFIIRSWQYHWRSNVAVALGAAVTVAVITGALVLGDSLRGSLRALTEERLGRIDFIVAPGRFFAADLADRWQWAIRHSSAGGALSEVRLVGVMLFPSGVVETEGSPKASRRRAGNCQIIGVDANFWKLDRTEPTPTVSLEGDQVVLNASLAEELQVAVGDLVTVRLPLEQAVPADSPLGRRDAESEGLPRLKVVAILPDQGLGRFALQAAQAAPLIAWLPISMVQEALDREGQINVLFADVEPKPAADEARALATAFEQALPLTLDDFGLRIRRVTQRISGSAADAPAQTTPIFDYYSVNSSSLLIPEAASQRLIEELGSAATPLMTYLANAIEKVDADSGTVQAMIPYSTITAIDSGPGLPLDFGSTPLEAGPDGAPLIPLALNSWAAERLQAAAGQLLRIAYYQPETVGGHEIERTFWGRVRSIVPVTAPATPYRRGRDATFAQPPTIYNDPALTPEVPGVTDQESISDWDLPFPLEREISKEDDRYWNEYRLTPKVYIRLADGQRMFGSRFGDLTGLRISTSVADSAEALAEKMVGWLGPERRALGWSVRAIRAEQEAASAGTTPFDALFLALSMFLIVAALLLISLLLRLAMQQRASEAGVLLATGVPGSIVSRLALGEGLLGAALGGVPGVLAGMFYARGLLSGLTNWWLGAITVPFLQFHARATSLLAGYLAGVLMAAVTIYFTARQLRRAEPRWLLTGQIESPVDRWMPPMRWLRGLALGALLAAMACAVFGLRASGPAQAGAFVGGGMLLLISALAACHAQLRQAGRGTARADARYTLESAVRQRAPLSLWQMAWRNVASHPLRSTLTIGLLAIATFLIVAMSAFQQRPTGEGVGGFDLLARTAQPLYRDLGDRVGQQEELGEAADQLADVRLFSFRVRGGQDASCNNLYRANSPEVLGVPVSLAELFDDPKLEPRFAWAGAEASVRNPWRSLEARAQGTADDPLPMIVDQNTAMWSLGLRGGVGELAHFEYDDQPIYFRVVGLLSNSVLQGRLLIGEQNFRRAFPQINGFAFFLIRSPAGRSPQVEQLLEDRLSDQGFDAVETTQVLGRLLEVQNTYLRTFQSLGALGLLLGSLGVIAVQLRSVLERRRELALLQALGFAQSRLRRLVLCETGLLLGGGMVLGIGTALLAVVPFMVQGRAHVPWFEPAMLVGIVLICGLLAAAVAVQRALHAPLLSALRGA